MMPSGPVFHPSLRLAAAVAGLLGLCAAAVASPAGAQDTPPASTASSPDLDTLVAPIALYPDALVANILPASTYPVQVVDAARDTANGAKPTASQMSQWNSSVQALVEFPTVLAMMSNQLDWTTQLGQAVAQSQSDVMAAVQRVRTEAQKAGNLQSNDKQTVTAQGSAIIIQPANPQVIYVPQYNPVTIIEPAPEYAMAPAGYGMMTFGLGFAAGALTAYACDWGHGYGGGSINVNNNYNYNNVHNYDHTTVNANRYSSWKAPTNVGHIGAGPGGGDGGYGSTGAHASGSGMFAGADGGGWSARAASERGAQSLGDGGLGRGFGSFHGAGGSFRGGGHAR